MIVEFQLPAIAFRSQPQHCPVTSNGLFFSLAFIPVLDNERANIIVEFQLPAIAFCS